MAYSFDNPLRRIFHKPEKIFSPYLQDGMTAADIGCGMGYFSISMARIVGDTGKVISADLQQPMLNILKRRAAKAGIGGRITTVLCDDDHIGFDEKADFTLAFWMAHETPDQKLFLKQVHATLKDSGKLLVAEPKMHVTVTEFYNTLSLAQHIGFKLIDSPQITFSHTAVLEKE